MLPSAAGRVEITATVSETVAEALENAKTLLAEGSSVVVTNIAGAGFEPCDPPGDEPEVKPAR